MAKNDEERLKKAFKEKNWNEIQTSDSWSIFKVISEMVEGFEKLSRIGPCVSVFGSARLKPENKYFKLAEELGYLLTQKGFGVITGGGPGIMEAANMGSKKGKGRSVGICIDLPFEQGANLFIDRDKLISCHYFFVRKVMFVKYAQGFIVMPGGFGTFDELFEALTLIQTEKIGKFPIVLIGKEYWQGLIKWLEDKVLKEYGSISDVDMELFKIVDTAEEAVDYIEQFYKKYLLSPNF